MPTSTASKGATGKVLVSITSEASTFSPTLNFMFAESLTAKNLQDDTSATESARIIADFFILQDPLC